MMLMTWLRSERTEHCVEPEFLLTHEPGVAEPAEYCKAVPALLAYSEAKPGLVTDLAEEQPPIEAPCGQPLEERE
jgi:hypothetical protein